MVLASATSDNVQIAVLKQIKENYNMWLWQILWQLEGAFKKQS